jgi:hypothetical protein
MEDEDTNNCSYLSSMNRLRVCSQSESDDNCEELRPELTQWSQCSQSTEWTQSSQSTEWSQSSQILRQITGQFPGFAISCQSFQTNSINNLDDYSLYSIFSKLTFIEKLMAQKVCQKWQNLIKKLLRCQTSIGVTISCAVCHDIKHQVSSYECIGDVFDSAIEGSVNTKSYFVNADNLSLVLSECPNLKSLILQNCIFCRGIFEVFAKYCSKKLEHLDLSHSSCNINEILQIISEKCSHTLKHVMLRDNEINESGLKCLIKLCNNLEVLILDQNDDITGDCFDLFGEKITYLSIYECKSIDESGLNSLVSGNGKHLTRLKIGNTIKPSMFRLVCEQLNQLKCLEFDGYKTESANTYNCISLLTSLEELILTLPRIIFDAQLIEIMRKCRQLKKVKIDGAVISDVSLKQFTIHCPLIEQISITPLVSLTNSLITDGCRFEIGSLKNLKTLSICGASITDEFVRTVRLCPRLTFIELDACKSITNTTLELCIEMAKSRPNDKIMLFAQKTKIGRPSSQIPSNLSVFGSWTI